MSNRKKKRKMLETALIILRVEMKKANAKNEKVFREIA